MGRPTVLVAVALLSTAAALQGQAARPLPEPEAFFVEVRNNLLRANDETIRSSYKERRTELRTNPFGRLGTGPPVVYEFTATADPRVFYRRLLERDGKPISNSPPERLQRRSRSTSRASFEDVVSVLTFAIDRREQLDGRSVIVIKFKPQPDAKPKTRQGRIAHAMAGDIWVDEESREVVKVEAKTIEDITLGYGLIARLGEGTDVTVLRRRVLGDVWAPVSVRFKGEGRALLFRKLNVDYRVDWYDYRNTVE